MKNVFEKFLTIIRTPVKVAVILSLLLPAINSFSQFEIDDPRVLNQFIVMLKPDSKVENFMEQFPALHINRCLSKHMNIFLVERNSTVQAEEFLQTIKTNRLVKLAQFNHRIKQRSLIPNDSNFSSQWNMLNTGQGNGVPGADIDATDAWSINNDNVTAEGDTVVIAIIDATFDLSHPDINYFTNYNEIPGNSIDDDGNGYIDDVNGWNVYDTSGNTNSTGPQANHSTHLAGIAGGIGNNGVGIAGVCWGAKILPVAGSSEFESEVVAAYEYVMTMRRQYDATAGTQGAYVVSTNTSFGVDNGQPDSFPIWCAMYDSMGALGILSAGATANMGINVDTQHDIPTECPSNYLLAVTNTNRNDGRNTNAAYGSVSIDLGAPGTSVFSTFPSGSYQTLSGTSMAAPHVAGAVAAMYAAACKGLIDAYTEKPDSIALLIKEYLLDGAEWITALNNKTVTGGRLNLYRAIKNLSRFNCDSCQFDLSMAKVPISCYGINDGAMAVNVPGDFAVYSFQWSNGLQTVECLSMAPGFYDVSVIDSLGCRRYFTDELHYPDSIHITAINIIPALNGNPGNITIVANAGNAVLTYSIDGSTFQSGSTFVITTNGTYTVYIKNESGCVVQRTFVISGVKELDGLSWTLSVYPNPATDELTIYCPLFAVQKTALEVFDVTGRKIFSTAPTTANWQLTTANWNNGVYFLSVETEGAKLTKMFVVNK